MNGTLEFLARHGYWILVGVVLGRQACLPIPTNLFFLAAGALGRSGRLNPVVALGISVVTFLLADLAWYEGGRQLGDRLLHLLCGLSREPDSCVDRATRVFAKHGVHTLLVSKFVLGLDAVAAPLSGKTGVNPMKFLLFDAVGATFWSSAYLILGYVFSNELESVAVHIARTGAIMTLAATAGFAYLMMNKLARWLRFLHQFTGGKISPEELRHKLDAGEDVMIVDLQGSSRDPRARRSYSKELDTPPPQPISARGSPSRQTARNEFDRRRDFAKSEATANRRASIWQLTPARRSEKLTLHRRALPSAGATGDCPDVLVRSRRSRRARNPHKRCPDL